MIFFLSAISDKSGLELYNVVFKASRRTFCGGEVDLTLRFVIFSRKYVQVFRGT